MTANVSKVNLSDGREVCLSYGVPVAAFIPAGIDCPKHPDAGLQGCGCKLPSGYIRTAEKFSVTTSKHANAYAGKDSPQVDAATFAELIAPVVVR